MSIQENKYRDQGQNMQVLIVSNRMNQKLNCTCEY